jgi:uncharacterized protein GlcG (DUF336 family)
MLGSVRAATDLPGDGLDGAREDEMTRGLAFASVVMLGVIVGGMAPVLGEDRNSVSRSRCGALPSWERLKAALTAARNQANGGLNLDMWGTIVDRDGVVCAVAFTGRDRTRQWPGSRVISAQKANTANAFSLPGLALSTANLFTAVQPGGSLFGLQESNPVATDVAYRGNPRDYGQQNDPMVGGRIGGVNVFGGGLGLYNERGALVGGIGVSGDTSCADHNIAYRTRSTLELDHVPAGVAGGDKRDNIIFDIVPQGGGDMAPGAGQMPGVSASGFGHPSCHGYRVAGNAVSAGFAAGLPANR